MSLAINPYHDDGDDGCPKCGSDDCAWEMCWSCGGEGGSDAYEEDPINFAPDEEWDPCHECGGHGGWVVCHECQRRAAKLAAGGGRE
jgi:hypothetical protein